MSAVSRQTRVSQIAEQMTDRLAQMNVAVGAIDEQGRLSVNTSAREIDRLVVQSPLFVKAFSEKVDELIDSEVAVSIFPGLWLMALPTGRRRRSKRQRSGSLAVAILLTVQLLESEQFQLMCDQQQVDRIAMVNSVLPEQLVADSEVDRLVQAISWMHQDSIELSRRNVEVDSMSMQLTETYEELSLVYKLSTNMLVNRPPSEILLESCHELQQVVGVRWLALQLIEDDPRLNDLAGQIYIAGDINCDSNLLKRLGKQLMKIDIEANEPLVVDDVSTLGIAHLSKVAERLLVIPIARNDGSVGILFAGDKVDKTEISTIDCKLCSSLANSLNMFLENMMLFDDMQAIFMGTLHALTSSIDAKDSYTRGHSERVAMMSRKLAEVAGLSEHDCERVYLAGLLHDIGKIGVPESVLTKPGKLTNEEFGMIKEHPEVGAGIISDIRQMHDLIPGVLCHHERWDGRGYPDGLAGEDIPIYGRVICLADSFDAMSSTRTYRSAMPIETVLQEIANNGGTQFDPRLAELFVNLDLTDFFEMIEKHQNIKVTGAGGK